MKSLHEGVIFQRCNNSRRVSFEIWDLILITKESYKLSNYDWHVKLLKDQRIVMVQTKGC
jgi:hypothetical protein